MPTRVVVSNWVYCRHFPHRNNELIDRRQSKQRNEHIHTIVCSSHLLDTASMVRATTLSIDQRTHPRVDYSSVRQRSDRSFSSLKSMYILQMRRISKRPTVESKRRRLCVDRDGESTLLLEWNDILIPNTDGTAANSFNKIHIIMHSDSKSDTHTSNWNKCSSLNRLHRHCISYINEGSNGKTSSDN